jgi:hypothetical protein
MKNHISLSINLYWIKIWSDLEIKSENWLYGVKYSKSQLLRVNTEVRSSVATLMKSMRNEVTRINIVQSQVEELYFIFNLEYMLPLYQEVYHMDCQQSLNAQHSPKIQVRWVKHNDLIHCTYLWTIENRMFLFTKPDVPVCQTGVSDLDCNDYNSNFRCSVSKTGCSDFYWLVGRGAGIKASPSLLWRLLVPPTKILIPYDFVSSSLHLLVRFVWLFRNQS